MAPHWRKHPPTHPWPPGCRPSTACVTDRVSSTPVSYVVRAIPNLDAHHFPPRANAQAASGREHQLDGRLDGEVTNLKVGDPAATTEPFQFSYEISANFLTGRRNQTSSCHLPSSTWRTPTRTKPHGFRADCSASRGIQLSRKTAAAREVHGARSSSVFPEARLRRVQGQLQTGRLDVHRRTHHVNAGTGTAGHTHWRLSRFSPGSLR